MEIRDEIRRRGGETRRLACERYFKTGKGGYGEGDKFYGVPVPELRKIAKENRDVSWGIVLGLIRDPYHECRMVALLILLDWAKSANEQDLEKIVRFYLKNTSYINNWDLVDVSAPLIVGKYFFNKEKKKLDKLVYSRNLWERRIAVISTFYFIREGAFAPSLEYAEILLDDKHDLIHKAVGWMLREIGKRDMGVEEKFLKKFAKIMPSVTFRYAIEKFSPQKRERYLKLR